MKESASAPDGRGLPRRVLQIPFAWMAFRCPWMRVRGLLGRTPHGVPTRPPPVWGVRAHSPDKDRRMVGPAKERESTRTATPCVVTINGGSSSIRFALYEAGEAPRRLLSGRIDRIGLGGTSLAAADSAGKPLVARRLVASDHHSAAGHMLDWLEARAEFAAI